MLLSPDFYKMCSLLAHLLHLASATAAVSFVLFAVLYQAGQLPAMAASRGSCMLRTKCGALVQLDQLLMLQETPSPPDTVACAGC